MTMDSINSKTCELGRILVLDDELPIREMLVRWLRAAGYQCQSAANVDEAFAVLDRCHVDLVISDLRMPGRSGLDFLEQLQTDHSDLAVIMLTGCEVPLFAPRAVGQGAWVYLQKPVERNALLIQVSRVLERRRLIDDARNRTFNLEGRVNSLTRLIRLADEEVIHRLVVASMARDDETGAHIKRIGLFSAAVAEAAGWSSEAVDNIRLAAQMRDIGNIGIPDAILLKPGKFTAEEFEIMKTHTVIGASILRNSDSDMMQLAEEIARSHHEWWNGSGYPDGLCAKAIPPAARIVAIVDVYDALTHDRVYRPALPESEALSMIKQGRYTHFDPELLDMFLSALPAIRELAQDDGGYELASQGSGTMEAVLAFKQSLIADELPSDRETHAKTADGRERASDQRRSTATPQRCVANALTRVPTPLLVS